MAAIGICTGQTRGNAQTLVASQQNVPFAQADHGEMIAVNAYPAETELTRLGLGYAVVGTGVTAVAVIPTTAAHLSLYNGNTDRSLVITAVGGIETTSTAAAGQLTMLVRNDVPGQNANPAGALLIFGTNGSQYGGSANAKASVTLAPIGAGNNVGWVPAGPSIVRVTTTGVGTTAHYECFGRWVVRPTGLFSLASFAQTAAGTITPYIYFYEVIFNNP